MMKERYYANMVNGKLVEVAYVKRLGRKPSHVYTAPDYEIHVYGTYKHSRMTRDRLDYAVLMLAVLKGHSVKELCHV